MRRHFISICGILLLMVLGGIVACSSRSDRGIEDPGGKPVILAAGDIAECESEGDDATAKLLGDLDGTILTLGDNAYPRGSPENYRECYEPTWGEYKDRTRPAPGNHEYYTEDAEGYFDYFGEVAGNPDEGYYSFDLGKWHVVSLNSSCERIGGCTAQKPQAEWLEKDLAASDSECTLAYFHEPLFTSGEYSPGAPKVRPLWEILYEADADVVLSAHDHNYQRFAPQTPDGEADPERGIRQFVVGTGGGENLYEIEDPIENSEVTNDETYGVLRLALDPSGYEWRFVPAERGTFTDSGSGECH